MSTGVWYTELEFHINDFRSLQLPPRLEAQSYEFLTRQVGRHRKGLIFHICRIKAAAVCHEEAIYGSLVDLIWVLKDKGLPLQRRMLQAARNWLPNGRYELLHRFLEGRLPLTSIPCSPCSLFHEGVWGDIQPFFDPDAEEQPTYDPVKVATGCLEAGQIDHARELLEKALIHSPENPEVRQHLLEIYQATRDMQHFLESFRHLESNRVVDPAWREMQAWFMAQAL